MNRRHFHRYLLAGLPLYLATPQRFLSSFTYDASMKAIKKPLALRPGDTIGLIAPASAVNEAKAQKAVQNLEKLGFKTVFAPHALHQDGFLAGTDQDRLSDLHQFFADPQINGIWCLRGGYGTMRLLSQIDYRLIRKNPKVLIGYSDITALLLAVYQKSGLVCFHGPVASSDFTDTTIAYLRAALMDAQAPINLSRPAASLSKIAQEVQGPLVGGNLSLLAALCGSAYAPDYRGKMVFLEDIGEKPYRIDRMLTQLLLNGLGEAAGIILGDFVDCEMAEGDRSWSLVKVFDDRLGALGIPLCFDAPFGHISDMATFPIGMPMKISSSGNLSIIESGVETGT